MAVYNEDYNILINKYNSSIKGLNNKIMQHNKTKYGENDINEKKSKSKIQVFFEQFKDVLVLILITSAIISIFTGGLESTIVIFIVIIFNGIIGTIQYSKAERSINSLKAISGPIANVIRDNKIISVLSKDVVVGDILYLVYGDVVCADARIIECRNLEVDESALTGESLAILKHNENILKENISIGEIKNCVFKGSKVIKGNGLAIVYAVGMNTQIGSIANLMTNTIPDKSPLEISLEVFSRNLAIIIIFICSFVFIMNLFRNVSLIDSLMFAVALAVAAIPEALSVIVTIVLAIGTQRMASEKAIVKELKAVEALGCVNVICTDKTGTLTEGKMTFNKIYFNNQILNKDEFIIKDNPELINCLALCNDAIDKKSLENITTDSSIMKYLIEEKIKINIIINKYKRIYEIPFDSKRKMMSTINEYLGRNVLFCKGAPEIILNKSKSIIINGVNVSIALYKNIINQNIRELASKGLRLIGFGYKDIGLITKINENDEKDLIFLGIIGFSDPPKVESYKAIQDTMNAGIRPIMITGDYKETALSIANELNICNDNKVLIGEEIDKLNDEDLIKKIREINVYARVSPENKIRIVTLLQKLNNNVAFIGDGVNDAPAIRKSNVGVSMGISGTEVSKEASSIILIDDNYATIVKAIETGRNIYANIQNAILFLISGNIAGIIAVLFTSLLNLPIPFVSVHLLFINLITDSLPAIAIGMEKGDNTSIKQKPRKKMGSILNKRVTTRIIIEGILISLFTLIAYFIGLKENVYVARTLAFSTICLARLYHSFNCRGRYSVFKKRIDNKPMVLSFCLGIVLVNLVLFVPILQKMFMASEITIEQYLIMNGCAIFPSLIIQGFFIQREIKYKKRTML